MVAYAYLTKCYHIQLLRQIPLQPFSGSWKRFLSSDASLSKTILLEFKIFTYSMGR